MAWDRACPCTRCRPGHAAAGSTRRSSTTPRCCASSSNASAWPNNISPWRRAVCGDLTSLFDFSASEPSFPGQPCRRPRRAARPRCRRRHAHRAGPTAARPPAARPATLARPALRAARACVRAHALTLRLDNPARPARYSMSTIGCTWSADHGAIPSRPASAWTASGIRQRTAAATTCGCSAPTASIATSPDVSPPAQAAPDIQVSYDAPGARLRLTLANRASAPSNSISRTPPTGSARARVAAGATSQCDWDVGSLAGTTAPSR